MIGKIGLSRKNILFSAALLCLSLGTFIYAAIIDHWPDFLPPIFVYLTGFILWLIWIFHLGWILLRRRPEHGERKRSVAALFGTVLGSMVLFVLVLKIGSLIADEMRLHDIRMAVNAGLRNDCINLLHHWPANSDTLDASEDSAFAKLPHSIQLLKPTCLYKDEFDDTNWPPNIGVCWSAFGGFYGTRVFQNDDDAQKLKVSLGNRVDACERVAPGVYFWVDQ